MGRMTADTVSGTLPSAAPLLGSGQRSADE